MVAASVELTDHRMHTLHICIGPSCLIFQIQNAPSIPRSLVRFLADWHFTFVGVNNISVTRRLLLIQYDINISNKVVLFELVGDYIEGCKSRCMKNCTKSCAKTWLMTISNGWIKRYSIMDGHNLQVSLVLKSVFH